VFDDGQQLVEGRAVSVAPIDQQLRDVVCLGVNHLEHAPQPGRNGADSIAGRLSLKNFSGVLSRFFRDSRLQGASHSWRGEDR
jgi:hypothetical protein